MNLKQKLIIFLVIVFVSTEKVKLEYKENVLVLTTNIFDRFIQKSKFVFVKFYAPWCGHCKTMAPSYSQLAKKMREEKNGIVIAKVDGTIETQIAEEYGVKGFPDLKLFYNGYPIDYSGERTGESIENWIKNTISKELPVLTSFDDIAAIENNKLAFLLVCSEKDTNLINRFKAIALGNFSYSFYITYLGNASEYFESPSRKNIIAFRNFDDGTKIATLDADDSYGTILEFFSSVKDPAVLNFDDHKDEIFYKQKPALILFSENPEKDSFYHMFEELAKQKKKDILFVKCDYRIENNKKVAAHFGIYPGMKNQVRIAGFEKSELTKYRPVDSRKETLVKFIEDFRSGKLKTYLKSLPVVKDQNALKTVVADNFNELIWKNKQYILLSVYLEDCEECKKLKPVLSKLAEKVVKVKELMIGEIEGVMNEIPALKVKTYPTIYYFSLKDKKHPIEFKGRRNFESLLRFLEKEMDRDLVFAEDMDLDDGL